MKLHPLLLEYVEHMGMARLEQAWEAAERDARSLLAAHGFALGGGIGHGHFAQAFELENEPDYIVKLTGDPTDAAAWARVAKSKTAQKAKALAKTPCAFALPTTYKNQGGQKAHMYAIVQERLTPLNQKESWFINRGGVVAGRVIACAAGYTGMSEELAEYFPDCPDPRQNEQAFAICIQRTFELAVLRDLAWPRKVSQALFETYETLLSIGVIVSDLHAGNMMRDAAGWVKFTDLGLSSVRPTQVARLK